ncbi:MAG: glycosyltransferase family 4 protein [Desulfuromonadales bacterium]
MPDGARRLRVLMSADTVGGVWDYALELARQCSGLGVDVVLATMGRLPSALQQRAAAQIPRLLLHASPCKLEWMPDAGDEPLQAGEWLLQLEERYAPDIVHLNGYFHAVLPWRAPCLVVAHSCVLSWWQAVKGTSAPAQWQGYAERVRQGLHCASRVVFPTAALRSSLEALYGRLPRATVIRNGRDPGQYRPARKENHIFTAGRFWDEGKNLSALSHIAADLPWPVYAAGEWRCPNGGGVRPAQVEFLGCLSPDEMRGRLGRAAIYALPARYEPFGLSILEAALSGCVLVLGDLPTLHELWDGAALFVPPDDHNRLRTTLRALIAHPAWRQSLADAARERALHYSAATMAAAYVSVYHDLLHPRQQTGTAFCRSRQAAQPVEF